MQVFIRFLPLEGYFREPHVMNERLERGGDFPSSHALCGGSVALERVGVGGEEAGMAERLGLDCLRVE